MSALAGLIAAAGFDDGLPVALATVDAAGTVSVAVAGTWLNGRPVTPDDSFYGASLAKQLTGAAAALLVRAGRLDADAPIAGYLDGLPAWGEKITARQLAHHSAGLPEAGLAEAAVGGDWTEAAVTQYLGRLVALGSPPGTEHRYANLGYILLARLVAKLGGMPFAQFVAERLCGGDADSGFVSDVKGFPQAAGFSSLPLTQGDGGLWTTAGSFARWLSTQNRDPLHIADLVEAPGRLNDGTLVDYGWGLGLRRYRGERLLIHGGSWTGATAKALRCPALGLAVVVLTAGGDMAEVAGLADVALELAYASSTK